MLTIILGILALILGIFLIATSAIAIIGTKKQQKRCSAAVSGTVCQIRAEERTHKKTVIRSYTPVFEYTAGGKVYQQPAMFPSSKPAFAVHDVITVRYNPEKPEDFFVVENKQNSTQGSVNLLWFGCLFLLGAMMAFFA